MGVLELILELVRKMSWRGGKMEMEIRE